MQAWDQLLQPIPGSNPAGANVRYDAVYDKLKEARREEEDVDQGEWKRPRKVADWPLVIKLASDALATKSKDLQIAAWLTEALLRQEGLGGLHAGLGVLRGLLDVCAREDKSCYSGRLVDQIVEVGVGVVCGAYGLLLRRRDRGGRARVGGSGSRRS